MTDRLIDQPAAEPAKEIKLEDIRATLTRLSSEKGAEAVKKLLAAFGAKKLSDVPANLYRELTQAAAGEVL